MQKILSAAGRQFHSVKFWHRYRARKLAKASKRLDVCASQVAHSFHLTEHPSLRNKDCLEIGTGWVLSHALILYLLGAKRVVAVDVEPLACPSALSQAIRSSVISLVRDVLSPFDDHCLVRERLEGLMDIKRFDFQILQELGIEYRAPINLVDLPVPGTFDFIFSNSVLEHVPRLDVAPLLNNLALSLRSGGTMIHHIHLEDHLDIQGAPFAFLAEPGNQYTRANQSSRGNRIRSSAWMAHFSELPDVTSEYIYQWSRINAVQLST